MQQQSHSSRSKVLILLEAHIGPKNNAMRSYHLVRIEMLTTTKKSTCVGIQGTWAILAPNALFHSLLTRDTTLRNTNYHVTLAPLISCLKSHL